MYLRSLEVVTIRAPRKVWWFFYIAEGPASRFCGEVGLGGAGGDWLRSLLAAAEGQIMMRHQVLQLAAQAKAAGAK